MTKLMQKEEAHKMVDRMPHDATWEDLIHEIYIKEAVENGMNDSNDGRVRDVKEVRAKYGLPE